MKCSPLKCHHKQLICACGVIGRVSVFGKASLLVTESNLPRVLAEAKRGSVKSEIELGASWPVAAILRTLRWQLPIPMRIIGSRSAR
jgi:hypothetical protein